MARRSSIRSGTTKSLCYAVLCVLIGAGLIIGGKATWSDPADCGGQTMEQGDTCEVTDNGGTTDRSLSDQEAANHREAVFMFVGGPLMVVGGGFWLRSEIRIRKRRGAGATGPAAVAGAGPFPGNGQFAPAFTPAQQQYAPQQPYGAVPPQQQAQPWPAQPAQAPEQQQPWPAQQPYQQPQQPYQQQPPQQPYQQSYQQPPQQGGWPNS